MHQMSAVGRDVAPAPVPESKRQS